MFKDEEEKLNQWKKSIEQAEIPFEKLNLAIEAGFDRATKEKSYRKRRIQKQGFLSIAAAAVLFFALITSIRVSPAFAHAVASIPGLEKLVELVSDNKGLTAAIENDFFQPVGVTETKDGVSVTLDGIIGDDTGMVLFYTIHSANSEEGHIEQINVMDEQLGENLPYGTISYGGSDLNGSHTATVQWQKKIDTQNMVFRLMIKKDSKEETFDIPFTYEDLGKKGKVYALNKQVEVQKQKITIDTVTINPISTEIKVKFDPKNTMRIYQFEDLEIVNQKGEIWTSIQNGVTASRISDDEVIYYLQSNYFDQPKNLYLEFGKIMALDKEQVDLVIDTERKEILKQPDDNRFVLVDVVKVNEPVEATEVRFKFKNEKNYKHFPFSEVKDANGKEMYVSSSWQTSGLGDYGEWGLKLPDEPYQNPLTYKLTAHPNWIEGKVKIKLK